MLQRGTIHSFISQKLPNLIKVKANKLALKARKIWLKGKDRGAEILDSEFYYQLFPSLDMLLFDIDP